MSADIVVVEESGGFVVVDGTPDLVVVSVGEPGPQGVQGEPAAGSGDVVGPASATDGAVVVYDGATGKLVKNSLLAFTGPTVARSYALPDAAATLLYSGGDLGTPSAGVATNLTGTASGLTAGAVAVSGVTGLGTGVATFLATPSGANLASALTSALPVSKGGTNSTTALNNNRMMVSSGGAIVEAAAKTQGQVAYFDANGLPTGDTGLTYASGALTASVAAQVKTGSITTQIKSGGSFGQLDAGGASNGMWLMTGSVGGGAAVIRSNGASDCFSMGSNVPLLWTANGGNGYNATIDSTIVRAGAPNSLIFSSAINGASGQATSRTEINKAVTAIADATATAVFTVTVPNAAHSASIRVRLAGSMGAGGAVGANESTQDAEYMINIARTAGVNAAATIGAVVGQAAAASVVGADNVAVTGTLSAIAGAVGVANTFTINVTITKSAGASAAHTCLAFAELLNANTAGVTIS